MNALGFSGNGRVGGEGAQFDATAVSQREWDHEVACALRSLKANEVLNELAEVEDFIDAAVAKSRPDLIGAIYMAVRRAYAERMAFSWLYGKPMQGNDAQTVVANLLIGMQEVQ
jgi:hypothetical protein